MCSNKISLRVFVSGATLVVVPETLIGHWVHQVRAHMREGALRVLVFTGEQSKLPPANELAWSYDLVITTFTRWARYRIMVPIMANQSNF